MFTPLLLTLTLLTLSNAQDPGTTSSVNLGGSRIGEINAVQTTSPELAPRHISEEYPVGYLEEIRSLYIGITTEAAYTSVESIAAHATGVAGSAVTALSSLLAEQAANKITFTNDAGANSYLATLSSIYSLLPTEQQEFQSSVASRHSSIGVKHGVVTAASTTATKKAGAVRLGVGIGNWCVFGVAGVGFLGVVL